MPAVGYAKHLNTEGSVMRISLISAATSLALASSLAMLSGCASAQAATPVATETTTSTEVAGAGANKDGRQERQQVGKPPQGRGDRREGPLARWPHHRRPRQALRRARLALRLRAGHPRRGGAEPHRQRRVGPRSSAPSPAPPAATTVRSRSGLRRSATRPTARSTRSTFSGTTRRSRPRSAAETPLLSGLPPSGGRADGRAGFL